MENKYGRYLNLKLELQREGVTQEKAAGFLGMSTNNFNMKLNGKVPFTVYEVVSLRDEFAPDATLDYLLATD